MSNIEYKYIINAEEKIINYTNVIVTPDFALSQVTLTFPQITGTDYDNLYNDMEQSPTELEVKFNAFGADREYKSLGLISVGYHKTLIPDSPELYDLTIILRQ